MWRVEVWCDDGGDGPYYVCEDGGVMELSIEEDDATLYSKEQLSDVVSTILSKYDDVVVINMGEIEI